MKNSIRKIALASCIALALFSSCKTDVPIKSLCEQENKLDSIIQWRFYPNPAENFFIHSFVLPEKQILSSKIYDRWGRERAIFLNMEFEKGTHNQLCPLDSSLANGLYIVSLEICGKRIANRLIIKR